MHLKAERLPDRKYLEQERQHAVLRDREAPGEARADQCQVRREVLGERGAGARYARAQLYECPSAATRTVVQWGATIEYVEEDAPLRMAPPH